MGGAIGRAVGLATGLLAVAGAAAAQPPGAAVGKPAWAWAHDLRVRKPGVREFDKDTPEVGVEFFRDDRAGAVLAVSQAGSLAVARPPAAAAADRKAGWLYAHDLAARRADEERFTADTAKVAVEVFKDGPTGKLLYVSDRATIALADPPAAVASDRNPAWHHALVLKVRAADRPDFGPDSKRVGVEAYKDGNTGGLVYVSDAAGVAAGPAPPAAPPADAVKPPRALHGLVVKVRKAGEPAFGPTTRRVGVEVFRDPNTGGLLYVSEAGAIATAPAPAAVGDGRGVTWEHALEVRARPGGQADFANAARYGVEVYRDNNTGHLVYVADTGAIAVLPGD